ncbi:MAG: GIY-YIG nuclease family protein [Myxococcota bacterium]|nr:GIY-YIG nuclease family protein [Myxococcota bacterium]
MTQWFVYVLRCGDGTLYTGITTELERRLREHNDGVGARYTGSRRPLALAYFELAISRSSAAKREAQIKKMSRPRKLELIASLKASRD